MGVAVAVAVLVPGCARVNPAFEDGRDAAEGSGAGTSMGTTGTAPTESASTLPTGSASGVTGSGTLPTTTMPPASDVGVSGPSSDTGVMPSDWWDTEYAHRMPLVFHQREEPLLDFVTYVPLSFSPSRLEGVSMSQLAFVDVATDMRIPAEIAVFDPAAGEVAAWVQLPVWRADGPTEVFLYFGFTAPEVPSASPWSRHVAVWHMDEVTDAGSTPDAAGSADASQVGAVVASVGEVPGVVGGALEFDGEEHRLEAVLSSSPSEDSFLVSGWLNAASYPQLGFPLIARGDSVGPSWLDAEWAMGCSSDERAEGRLHDDQSNDSPQSSIGVSVPSANEWHHYAFLYAGSTVRFYVDGAGAVSGGVEPDAEHVIDTVSIGGYSSIVTEGWEERLLEGRIDELRWRRGADEDAPNDVWVETLYESQLTPETTFTPAPVEDL